MTPTEQKAFLTLARERWKQAEEADHAQRKRELDDLAFYAGDQWPADVRKAREGQGAANGLPPIPAQPCLTINRTREPIRQVLNEADSAEVNIELAQADDFGDDTVSPDVEAEIELREGLIRRMQRAPEAKDALDWAGSRAAIAGRGYFVVMTRYMPGKTNNQEIYFRSLYNQASVLLDPAHEQKDGSDCEWEFIGSNMTWDQYTAEFPHVANGQRNHVTDAGDQEWRALGDEAPGWFTSEGETKSVRVTEYFYTERSSRTLCEMADGTCYWQEELPEGAKPKTTREVIEKAIKWAKIDGVNILDETDWAGPDMPIVKLLGEELHPYDNERRVEGMVRPMRDAGQGSNAMISKLVGDIGYAPIPPFQATPDQIAGFEEWYKLANTRALPYLPYNHESDQSGKSLGPPTRTNIDTPISAVTAAIAMFNDALQSTSGVHDPVSLAKSDSGIRKSGRALDAMLRSSSQGTSHYMSNRQRSMRYAGQIVNNLLYPIFGQPGRLARIVTGTGESKTIKLAGPDAQGGPNRQKVYRLTKDAAFNVAIKITPSFQTRREEMSNILAQLISANPEFMFIMGDLFFKHQDGPGHQEMAERMKAMLNPKVQAMLAAETEGGPQIPPAVQAQLQAQQAQIQAAEAALAETKQALDTKRVEQEGKVAIAEKEAARDIELQAMKDATTIEVAKINAAVKGLIAKNQSELEAIALDQKSGDAEMDRQHQAQTQQTDQQHDAEMQAGQQSHEADMGAMSHQQTLEANEQQAELAPEPAAAE